RPKKGCEVTGGARFRPGRSLLQLGGVRLCGEVRERFDIAAHLFWSEQPAFAHLFPTQLSEPHILENPRPGDHVVRHSRDIVRAEAENWEIRFWRHRILLCAAECRRTQEDSKMDAPRNPGNFYFFPEVRTTMSKTSRNNWVRLRSLKKILLAVAPSIRSS